MAQKPFPKGVDLDEVEKSDGMIIQIGRGSVPPPEPTITEELRAMSAQMDEDELYYDHAYSNPPPKAPRTNLGDVVRRAYAANKQTGEGF